MAGLGLALMTNHVTTILPAVTGGVGNRHPVQLARLHGIMNAHHQGEQMVMKPKLKLVGNDGNAFAIMAACRRAGMKAGWSTDRIGDLLKRMMSGNYDNLLTIAAEEFDVS
jgi:hypothetical protein